MAGTITELVVAAKLAVRAIGRRLRGELEAVPDRSEFRRRFQAVIDKVPDGIIADTRWCEIDADAPPWIDSGMKLTAGDEATYFICGRTTVVAALDIWVDPRIQVWSRFGRSGEVTRATRESHSFVAPSPDSLYFGNYFPNYWADATGTLGDSERVYRSLRGGYTVLLIRWQGTAREGLKALQSVGDYQNRIASEIERIDQGDIRPRGWRYFWAVGDAEVYREDRTADGAPCIRCRTERDVGILQYDVDLPLTPATEIAWRWRVDELPSDIREDAVPSHDYLSIAVEFDDGRDITYYWSSTLPEGTGYDCPLPAFKGKEYHVVIRSGENGLGEWLDERRNLYRDHEKYMGPPPARIVRIWLIANSVFQRRCGECRYAGIVLQSPDQRVEIL